MEIFQITYYTGIAAALFLCWNLGPLFYSYIILNIVTDILLDIGWLAAGDMRLKWAVIQWLDCIWILMLANIFRSRFEAVLMSLLVLIAFGFGIYPRLTEQLGSWEHGVELTTQMMRTWAIINLVIVLLVFAKTLYLWKAKKRPNDLVVNPRRRFLLPIAAFSAIVAVPLEWIPSQPMWLESYRFSIAAHTQVWGWVIVELKFYLQARSWRDKYG